MNKLVSRASKKHGLKPGAVIYVGKSRTEDVHINVIDYTKAEYTEKIVAKVEDCISYKESPTITWINVDGIHNVEIIEKLGNSYGLHPLVQEDVVNTGQRPKMEDLGDYIFVVMKMLYLDGVSGDLKTEQVSIIFGNSWVITFQETGEDVFDMVRHRIKKHCPASAFYVV